MRRMRDENPSRAPDVDATFAALFDAHHRAILAYCVRRTSRTDAWDAASEVFVVAWRRLDQVPPVEEARPWLIGVADRVLSNQRRSNRRRSRLAERAAADRSGWAPQPDEPLIRREEEQDVLATLGRMRPSDREILQLSVWEGLSPSDISQVLDISREAVDQRYSRAKRRFAKQFQQTAQTSATQPTLEKGGAV